LRGNNYTKSAFWLFGIWSRCSRESADYATFLIDEILPLVGKRMGAIFPDAMRWLWRE